MNEYCQIDQDLDQFDFLKEVSNDLDYFFQERENISELSSKTVPFNC